MKSIGFFAYSSDPKSCGIAIEDAVNTINKSNIANIRTWRRLQIGGRVIIKTILDEIDDANFFLADLTGMNNNVLFEIGYALGKGKPVWLIIDTSIKDSTNKFNELSFLSTIGYSQYHNSSQIVNEFYRNEIYSRDRNFVQDIIDTKQDIDERRPFLYLKSQIPTDYSQEIINRADLHKLKPIIDDASENSIEPLEWYIENILKTPALLAEFSSLSRVGNEIQNMKCAFISGLAIGLGKQVLMVSERPYEEAPIDYRDMLKKYNTRESCARIVDDFLIKLKDSIAEIFSKETKKRQTRILQSSLQKINFGEFTAEHESEKVYEYYVETSHLETLIRNEYNIIVGRKGTGKTATLYYINQKYSNSIKNHICLIKPVNFEIEGVIQLLSTLNQEFEQGYLIETIWKFLIYTEIAKSVYETTKSKPLYAITEKESEFNDFINNNKDIFITDFATRLDNQVKILLDKEESNKDFKLKISEILHESIIFKIREFFADIIGKNEQIIVLIDNLDKTWKKTSDIPLISKFLLGLLGVTGRIARDLSVIKSKSRNLSFKLVIFLRSDILRFLLKEAREPDKIEITRLRWEDPDVLFRVIEERFEILSSLTVTHEDLWEKYVCKEVENEPVKEFIIKKIIPRPRDIIYFFRKAKEIAVSRGHIKIEENDLKQAYYDYSSWVFTSLMVEDETTYNQIKDFLYNRLSSNRIIHLTEIIDSLNDLKITTDHNKVNDFVDYLVELSILAREVQINDFRFEYDMENSDKIEAMAKKYNSKRFLIHPALHPYLELND